MQPCCAALQTQVTQQGELYFGTKIEREKVRNGRGVERHYWKGKWRESVLTWGCAGYALPSDIMKETGPRL